ncbi:MAG: STAS/SEC14 domain-containing protein [Deltaproteobacteria bacterium]|nr:STAS/SEC14 domain-containing protein [Deltaproteobacteria bacterium]
MHKGMNWISHRDRQILHLDFTDLTPEEIDQLYQNARAEIDKQPKSSVLLLSTISSKTQASRATKERGKEFAKQNTPYLKKSALVGASKLFKVIVSGFALATGRDIKVLGSETEALDWLVD